MLPKTLTTFLWHFVRPYRLTCAGMFGAVLLYAVLTSINPYLMKLIIDGVIAYPETAKEGLFSFLWIPIVLFVLLYQGMDLCWAMYDYFKIKTLPKVRADIINTMFSYLQEHSYAYFQRNFTGSLANKISDMARGAESVISQIVEPIAAQVSALLVATLSMYFVSPLAATVLLVWSVLFLGIAFFFYKKTLWFASRFSESNSVCMGKLVDSVTNIMSSKIFARNSYEKTVSFSVCKRISNKR